MLKYREPVSAFAMYAMKRKNAELSSNSKKLKRKHSSSDKRIVLKNDAKLKVQEKEKQTSLHKKTQETKKAPKINEIQNVNKISSRTCKKSKSIQKPIEKEKDEEIQISCSKKIESKKKLRSSVLMTTTGVAKMKCIKQKQQKRIKNRRLTRQDTQETADTNCNITEENHENPLTTSRSMFEWLIHPMKVEDFFE